MERTQEPVDAVLSGLRVAGSYFTRTEVAGSWGIAIPTRTCAAFHLVVEGECWVWSGRRKVRLDRGSFALVPRGGGHCLGDKAFGPARPIDPAKLERLAPNASALSLPGRGERGVLICGGILLSGAGQLLLETLPEIVTLEATDPELASWRDPLLAMLEAEVRSNRQGTSAIVSRLIEVLVLQATRHCLTNAGALGAGWAGAMTDPQIARALSWFHARPSEPWTLERVAKDLHMSRAVFAERFTRLVRASPMQYLTRLRMRLAEAYFTDEHLSVSEAAQRLGYGSEASFSRAFKRQMGVPPGAARRRARGLPVQVPASLFDPSI